MSAPTTSSETRDRRQSPKCPGQSGFYGEPPSDEPHRASEVHGPGRGRRHLSIRTLRRGKKDLGVDSFKRLDQLVVGAVRRAA